MSRVNLTDRRIAALLPDPDGKKRPELRDAIVPSLVIRVATKRKVFALHARFPNSKHPTRRVIAEVGAISLDDARASAREWLGLIRKGIDPGVLARERADAARQQRELDDKQHELLFANVAADYLKRKVAGQRRAGAVARIVNNVLVPKFGDRQINTIARRDVVQLVEQIDDRGSPVYAAACFGQLRALFNWAINRYDLDTSPCDRVKVAELVSRTKQPRQRVLSDDEIRCLWKGSGKLGYPWQPMFRLLLLTGTRRNEASGARWSELDLERKLWTIPPERFKSNVSHLLPLSDDAVAIVRALPRFKSGDHLFSFTYGRTPTPVMHKAKLRLDRLMLRYLRALARLRGDDPEAVTLAPWVVHDLRRTVRTGLARLEVNDTVAELAIGHGQRGLARVYNQHQYEPQIRRALELWAAELRRIVSPPRGDDNVVPLRGQGT